MTPLDVSLLINGMTLVVVVCGVLMLAAIWQMRRDMDRWHILHQDRVQKLQAYHEDTKRLLEQQIKELTKRIEELKEDEADFRR